MEQIPTAAELRAACEDLLERVNVWAELREQRRLVRSEIHARPPLRVIEGGGQRCESGVDRLRAVVADLKGEDPSVTDALRAQLRVLTGEAS